jgi:hypothetical protein
LKRFYYIGDDLDDLEAVERELEQNGISTPQIYILSNDDAGLETHHLNRVASFLKTDVIHAGKIGVLLGLAAATGVVTVSHFSGIAATVGWAPFIYLAVIALGFVTWEAAFIGIQQRNVHFRRFDETLQAGKHILFVETDPTEEDTLRQVLGRHATLKSAGIETTHTKWLMVFLCNWQRFRKWA